MMRSQYVAFGGGVDGVSPNTAIQPGALRLGINVECRENGGYRSTKGYERFDGQTSPSTFADLLRANLLDPTEEFDDAAWTKLASSISADATTDPNAGSSADKVVEDNTSSQHDVRLNYTVTSGNSYVLSVFAKKSERDTLRIVLSSAGFGANVEARFDLDAGTGSVTTPGTNSSYSISAFGNGWYRCSLIAEATATSSTVMVLGMYNGSHVYTGDGSSGLFLWGAQLEVGTTPSNYQKDGNSQEKARDAIGAPNGEGRIRGVHVYNGKVYAFRHVSGGASTTMWESSSSGWVSKKTGLSPNGTYRCINYSFGATQKMYIASGVHKAAEWDGTTWTDITTGMATDTPKHIHAHKKHLFLSFDNSVQQSPLGDPTGTWSVLTGSTEMLMPDTVTGFSTLPNGSLGIYTKNSIVKLAGTSSSDWVANNMEEYSNNAGAIADTVQSMGALTFFCDTRGVTELGASDTSSDLYDSLASSAVDVRFRDKWKNATASCVVRAKGQYRLFLSDGSGLVLTVRNGRAMLTEMEWPDIVYCAVTAENSSGEEIIYVGCSDGYVRQIEIGRNFDGESITTYMETAPFHCGVRGIIKRFRRVKFDTGTSGTQTLIVKPIFNIGNRGVSKSSSASPTFEGGGSLLGQESILGEALLGANAVREGDLDLAGHSEWISFLFSSSASNEDIWEIDGYMIDYLIGRKRR